MFAPNGVSMKKSTDINPQLPCFSTMDISRFEADLDILLAQNRTLIARITQSSASTWDGVMLPLIEANDKLDRFWSPVSHLNSVCDSAELRILYQRCIQKLSRYGTETAQNEALYCCFEKIANAPDFIKLSQSQQTSIQHALRDFRLAGVALPKEKKDQFKQFQETLAALQTSFEQNVLDATSNWFLHVTNLQDLAGVPSNVIELATSTASMLDKEGWVFTLHAPSYIPFMKYAKNRILRKKMYTAYITRASDQGPDAGCYDNSRIMGEILNTRRQMARLLDLDNYADLVLQTRMANSTHEVLEFLNDLGIRSRSIAEKEWAQLTTFATNCNHPLPVQPWDIAYLSEQLKQQLHHFTDEELRPYFPLPRVLDGLFTLIGQLYDIQILPVDNFDSWHSDVCCFSITDRAGVAIGYFYTDLYAREHKRGGAWMAECTNRFCYQQHKQLPTAFLTCNFMPPSGQQSCMLSHDEVVTLFHEFGHGLHHLLTTVDLPPVAGINGVPWDAVEMPSQFMEHYCWQEEIIQQISGHIDTGEPLPEPLFYKLQQARSFQTGLQMLRQLEFSLFDMVIHTTRKQNQDIQAQLNHIREQISIIPVAPTNRFQHSFSHVFGGSYASGYYSYKWAEVLAADVFSRFEEEGLTNPSTGADFRNQILSRGGTEPPAILFRKFRGRKPDISALLRYSGLLM